MERKMKNLSNVSVPIVNVWGWFSHTIKQFSDPNWVSYNSAQF